MLQPTSNWIAANNHFEKTIIRRIVISGYYRTFTTDITSTVDDPWIVSIDEHDKNINDLEGGADAEQLKFTIQDHIAIGQTTGWLTKDMGAGTVFEGSLVQLYIGINYPGHTMALGDYLLYWQGYVDQVDSTNSNNAYYFQCTDVTAKLEQTVYLIGDNGGQTSGDNLKTLTGHPLDIMLDILLNQLRDPISGQALDPTLVDTTKIESYRDGPFQGFEMLFHLSQAPNAGDFIKNQLLKPLGGYLWVSQGKITVNFFYPLAGVTPMGTIGQGDWTDIPSAGQTQMINTIQFSFDKDDGEGSSSGNYLSVNTQQYGPSIQKYGIYGSMQVNSDGLRASLQAFLLTWFVAYLIFGRYGFKNLTFDQDAAPGIMSLWLYEPGDVVYVTHSKIPNRKTGVMGITNYPFEILNKKTNFEEGVVTLTMIDASYLFKFGFSQIAPDNEPDYTSASPSDQATYMFQCGINGKYSNGNTGNLLG